MKSIYLKLILTLIPLLLINSSSYGKCSARQLRIKFAKEEIESIKKSFDKRNVEYKVDRALAVLAKCDIPLSEFGLTPGVFNFWKKRGYQAEFKKAKKSIEYTSQFNPVPNEKLEKLNKFGKKLDPNFDISQFNHLIDAGNKSLIREKASCTPVDNRNDKLGPVRNQDSIGWCYAFATADLLTHKLRQKVSAPY